MQDGRIYHKKCQNAGINLNPDFKSFQTFASLREIGEMDSNKATIFDTSRTRNQTSACITDPVKVLLMRKSLLLDNTFGIKGTASYYSQGSSSRTARTIIALFTPDFLCQTSRQTICHIIWYQHQHTRNTNIFSLSPVLAGINAHLQID